MSYRTIHKKGGGTGGRVIFCRHLWERLWKEEKLLKKRQKRAKQKATKRRAPIQYNSSHNRR